MNETIAKGLMALGYGMAGVFIVLILFYLLIKLMLFLSVALAPKTKKE